MSDEKNRRDPFADVGQALSSLLAEQAQAVEEPDPALDGSRGRRRRPRYASEVDRVKYTLDIDLEPTVPKVVAYLAGHPPAEYGPGPIRIGDLATAALILGLLEISGGNAEIDAEWTYASRGSRRVGLAESLEERWWTLIQACKIEG